MHHSGKKLILQGQVPECQTRERERDWKKTLFGKEHLRAECVGMWQSSFYAPFPEGIQLRLILMILVIVQDIHRKWIKDFFFLHLKNFLAAIYVPDGVHQHIYASLCLLLTDKTISLNSSGTFHLNNLKGKQQIMMIHIDNLSYLELLTDNKEQGQGAGKTSFPKAKQKESTLLPPNFVCVTTLFFSRIILKSQCHWKASRFPWLDILFQTGRSSSSCELLRGAVHCIQLCSLNMRGHQQTASLHVLPLPTCEMGTVLTAECKLLRMAHAKRALCILFWGNILLLVSHRAL